MALDTSFQIAKIESWHLRFPGGYWQQYNREAGASAVGRFEFREGWQTVYAANEEAAITRVTLADGSQGWGEPNVSVGPEIYCLILDGLVNEMVIGREFESPIQMWDFLYDAQRGRGYHSGFWLDALAGLDIAAWDALGHREQAPVHRMLGPAIRDSLPVYLSGILRETLDGRISHAEEWAEGGLQGAKIFLSGDVGESLRELDALRSGVPAMEKWMVDLSWMLQSEDAAAAKSAFGERGIVFLEYPLQPEDLSGHRDLWRQPGAPIALGEHFRTSYQLLGWISGDRALDVYQPDVGRTGFSDGLRQLQMAWDAGLDATVHMAGGTILQAATFSLSGVCRPTHLQEYMPGLTAKIGDAIETAWRYAGGVIPVPDAPGLGVVVHPDRLERYVVR